MNNPNSSPIKICYLLWSGGLGGAERHVFDLALNLPGEKFVPIICFLNQALTYKSLYAKTRIRVKELGLKNGYDLAGAFRFINWLSREKFPIIHDHISMPWTRFVIGTFLPQSEIIATIHNSSILRGHSLWQKLWFNLGVRKTRHFIAVSKTVQSKLIEDFKVPDTRVSLIPNFIDLSRFSTLDGNGKEQRKRSIGIPQNSQVLLSVGRLDAVKGVDRLIRAVSPLMATHKNLFLLIAGGGNLFNSLNELVHQKGLDDRVRFLGERLDIPALLSITDIFVQASYLETFGIAVAEAMAAGLPVVATKTAGLTDVVDEGTTGFLIDQDIFEIEFPKVISRLLEDSDLCIQLGINGRKMIEEQFSCSKIVQRIIGVYFEANRNR